MNGKTITIRSKNLIPIDYSEKETIKYNTVVVKDNIGIQGPSGKDGLTPHIDSETQHWIIGDYDTGVIAGVNQLDFSSFLKWEFYNSVHEFPSLGNSKIIYIVENNNEMYRWDENSMSYQALTPHIDYIHCEDVIALVLALS